jgi:hypothetical protein
LNTKYGIITSGIILISFLLPGCSSSEKVIKKATSIPQTETADSILTPLPTIVQTGTPSFSPALTNWNGIPIFPEAIVGKEYYTEYQFTTKSPSSMVKEYYMEEMIKLGWKIRPDMMAATSSDLVLEKDNEILYLLIKFDGEYYHVYLQTVQN